MSELLKEGYYHFITIESSKNILDMFCKQWNEHLEYCGSSLHSTAKPFKLLEISASAGRVTIEGVKRVSVTCVVLSTFSQDDNFNDFIENSITVPYNVVRLLSSFILLVPASQASITDAADWGSVAEIVTKSMQEVAGEIVSTNDSMTDVKTVNDLEERPYLLKSAVAKLVKSHFPPDTLQTLDTMLFYSEVIALIKRLVEERNVNLVNKEKSEETSTVEYSKAIEDLIDVYIKDIEFTDLDLNVLISKIKDTIKNYLVNRYKQKTVKTFTDTSTIPDELKGITDNYLKVLENHFRSVVGDAYKNLHQIYNCSGHLEHVDEAAEITLTFRKNKDITIILTQEGHSEKSVFDISTLINRE